MDCPSSWIWVIVFCGLKCHFPCSSSPYIFSEVEGRSNGLVRCGFRVSDKSNARGCWVLRLRPSPQVGPVPGRVGVVAVLGWPPSLFIVKYTFLRGKNVKSAILDQRPYKRLTTWKTSQIIYLASTVRQAPQLLLGVRIWAWLTPLLPVFPVLYHSLPL